MLIKSPDFKDYYDKVQAYGQDRSIMYIRKQRKEKWEKAWPFDHMFLNCESIRTAVIGFCGKVYPLVKLWIPSNYVPSQGLTYVCCYSADEVDDFVHKYYSQKLYEDFKDNKKSRYWPVEFPMSFSYKKFDDIFTKTLKTQNDFQHLFSKYSTAIFLAETPGGFSKNVREFIINPQLNNWQFYKVMDHYTAFTTLETYWQSQAQPIKPIPKVSDEDMIIAKGFDLKSSFRKPKHK